ncbi:YjgN family protein [Phenylobacterium sp.]|uniref:YjgN family protein n=1 Tax=Phenylobacterium sp. TaxID=1871053 RepID=UPI002DF50417|nr:DUF898 family protein [Phenylobacterium sp.]
MSTSDAVAAGDELVLTQRVSTSSFLGLSLRNGLLNLVTLTLYRFWGKTEVRRRLWRSVYLNGEPFEYTGRGVELFLGFLFALLVIVLPFLLIVFGAQLLGPAVAGLILLPFYIFLGFIAGYGRFTAFRYITSRSSWRGVRFQLKGSPAEYGGKWLGYSFLSGFTLGWFWPAAQRRLAAPLWDGLRFGDRRFRFDLERARRTPVYGAYALGWVGGVVAYLVFVALIVAVMVPTLRNAGSAPPQLSLLQICEFYVAGGLFALGYVVIFAPYHAAMLRSIVSGISFEGAAFELKLRWPDLAGMTLSNVALTTLSLGFLMPFAEARATRFIVQRIAIDGQVDLSAVRQASDAGPRTGEGLADAFGMSPI